MRFALSFAAVVLLVTSAFAACLDASDRHGRCARSLSWTTYHGPSVALGPRFHGHGQAVPIQRTKPAPAPVREAEAASKRIAARHPHKHFTFERTFVGDGQVVAGAPVVVPAVTTEVLVHQPSEEIVIATPEPPATNDFDRWHVEGVLDGTRLVVRRGGLIQQVRLLGVAAPAVEPTESAEHLEMLAAGQDVFLVFDEALAPQDALGVATAYVYLAGDGKMLNLETIRAGRGLAEGGYVHAYAELFAATQAEARDAGEGIWAGIPAANIE